MWPWRVKMATQNLLRMLLLLILMMRIVSATVCCRFGSWGLVIKPNFCSYTLSTRFGQDFEVELQARFIWWKDFKIFYVGKNWLSCRHWLPLSLTVSLTPSLISLQFVCDEMPMFGWDFAECLVEIMKKKFNQDLCLNLWYDPLGYFRKMNSTLRSVVPLAMFHSLLDFSLAPPTMKTFMPFLSSWPLLLNT